MGWAAAHFVVEDVDAGGAHDIFQELDAFVVVARLDCLFVEEFLLLAFVTAILETRAVQRVFVFVAAGVRKMKSCARCGRPLVILPLPMTNRRKVLNILRRTNCV